MADLDEDLQRRRVERIFARFAIRFGGKWAKIVPNDPAFELAIADYLPYVSRMTDAEVLLALDRMPEGPRDWPPSGKQLRELGSGARPVVPQLVDEHAELHAIEQAAKRDPRTAAMLDGAKALDPGDVLGSIEEAKARLGMSRGSGVERQQAPVRAGVVRDARGRRILLAPPELGARIMIERRLKRLMGKEAGDGKS